MSNGFFPVVLCPNRFFPVGLCPNGFFQVVLCPNVFFSGVMSECFFLQWGYANFPQMFAHDTRAWHQAKAQLAFLSVILPVIVLVNLLVCC